MRPSTACFTCRQGKRKCRQQPGEQACVRCQAHRLSCSFEPLSPTSTKGPLSTPTLIAARELSGSKATPVSPAGGSQPLASGPETVTAVPAQSYKTPGLGDLDVHRVREMPSFERDLELSAIPEVLVYATLALGARFANPTCERLEDPRLRGRHFAERAFQLIDLRDVSLSGIQACVLLATLCFTEGNTQSEAVYYATANRMAIVLDLPNRPAQSELERQTNLRVWWSLYMIDIWSSSGLRLPRQLQFDDSIPLPAEETYFLQSASASILPPPARGTGIWAEMARLALVWSEIMDMNRSSVEGSLSPMQLHAAVESLAERLNTWRISLPPFLRDLPANRAHYLASGLGTSFAALHLGFHYYSIVLYYQFMAAASQRNGFSVLPAQVYADRCTQHAMAFCDTLYDCDAATRGQDCMYIMLGHMLVVTSTVYVHMLLFNDCAVSADTLRDRLQRNFSKLQDLQQVWRTLESSLSRLKIFHNACLRSIEGSFDMDRWMLRFILEYGVNMPEKRFEGGPAVEDSSLAVETPGKSTMNLKDWYSETFTTSRTAPEQP